jgi:hypothetical protein
LILSNVSAHIQEKRPATLTTYRLSTRLGVYVAKLQTVCNCAYLVELHKKVSCLSLKKKKKRYKRSFECPCNARTGAILPGKEYVAWLKD